MELISAGIAQRASTGALENMKTVQNCVSRQSAICSEQLVKTALLLGVFIRCTFKSSAVERLPWKDR